MDKITGRSLSGWPHVEQSIGVLLTTPKRSRVMRRAFGAGIHRRVDMPISSVTLIDFYADIADAIAKFEPRYRVTRMSLPADPTAGAISLLLEGIYYPRGDLGDFSNSQPAATKVTL